MCETIRKPNILANTRDKEVIHQNGVVWHELHKFNRVGDFIGKISLGSENFASLQKFR